MGVNPSTFKQGGFLNGKDVTWTGYQFQVKTFVAKTGENAGQPFSPVNIELSFRIDGADEDVKTWLRMGTAEQWGPISGDGLQLGTPDGQGLSKNSQLGTFLASFAASGAPKDAFDADESSAYLSLANLVARRPRFRVETPVNEEKTSKFGQQVSRKTGQAFDRRDLVVTKFYGYTRTAQEGSGTTIAASNGDLQAIADLTLLAVVTKSGGNLAKGKLPTKVTAELGSKHPQLEAVRKLIYSSSYLEGLDGRHPGLAYDAESQTVMAVQ